MQEVVAMLIHNKGKTITNNLSMIKAHLEAGFDMEPVTRRKAKLMASFDLGANWDNLAESMLLFWIDDDGNILQPEQPAPQAGVGGEEADA